MAQPWSVGAESSPAAAAEPPGPPTVSSVFLNFGVSLILSVAIVTVCGGPGGGRRGEVAARRVRRLHGGGRAPGGRRPPRPRGLIVSQK